MSLISSTTYLIPVSQNAAPVKASSVRAASSAKPVEKAAPAPQPSVKPTTEMVSRQTGDQFVPSRPHTPIGIYQIKRDGNGAARVSFDDPDRRAEASREAIERRTESAQRQTDAQKQAAARREESVRRDIDDRKLANDSNMNHNQKPSLSEKSADDAAKKAKESKTIADTGRVDQELRELRSRQADLKKQRTAARDEIQQERLDRELQSLEQELAQKDNDSYRRQNTEFHSAQ